MKCYRCNEFLHFNHFKVLPKNVILIPTPQKHVEACYQVLCWLYRTADIKLIKKNKTFYFVVEYSQLSIIASGGQRKVRNTHSCIPSPPNSLPSRLPHNIKPSFLCYAVGQCCLSILNIVYIHLNYYPFKHSVYTSIPNSLSLPQSFTPATVGSFSKSVKLLDF